MNLMLINRVLVLLDENDVAADPDDLLKKQRNYFISIWERLKKLFNQTILIMMNNYKKFDYRTT